MLNKYKNLVKEVEREIKLQFEKIDNICEKNSIKVIQSFQECNLQEMHFATSTGYGIDEAGRNKIEEIYAKVFKAEDSLVRAQFISGTHALAITLSAHTSLFISSGRFRTSVPSLRSILLSNSVIAFSIGMI